MSNKLVKSKEQKEKLTGKQKIFLFWGTLIILSIAFISVWLNIFLTTKSFNKQMESMVLGKDYYMEDVVITRKRTESATSDNTISENHFFYYQNGKVSDYHKRMQVPGDIYSQYNVGDTITAYTTDHSSYSYYKYGILPDSEFRNNEIMKCIGVLLGVGILVLLLLGLLSNKTSS